MDQKVPAVKISMTRGYWAKLLQDEAFLFTSVMFKVPNDKTLKSTRADLLTEIITPLDYEKTTDGIEVTLKLMVHIIMQIHQSLYGATPRYLISMVRGIMDIAMVTVKPMHLFHSVCKAVGACRTD